MVKALENQMRDLSTQLCKIYVGEFAVTFRENQSSVNKFEPTDICEVTNITHGNVRYYKVIEIDYHQKYKIKPDQNLIPNFLSFKNIDRLGMTRDFYNCQFSISSTKALGSS